MKKIHTGMTEQKQSNSYARLVFKSASLHRVLDNLRAHYKAEGDPKPLVVPYVLTCAAYLESKLNDSLQQFAVDRYGEDVETTLMSLSLPKKLDVLVPLLTDGKYRINRKHFVYKRLASLIQVRNSVTHAKSKIEEITVGDEDLIPTLPWLPMQPRQWMNDLDITLGAAKEFTPLEYHEALDKLEKWFFDRLPDKLRKVAMVIDRSNDLKWKKGTVTYSKKLL